MTDIDRDGVLARARESVAIAIGAWTVKHGTMTPRELELFIFAFRAGMVQGVREAQQQMEETAP